MNNPSFLDTQHPNLIDTKKFGLAASCLPMATAGTDNVKDVAIRCRVLTQLYAAGNSSAFAEKVEISPTRWNNIERRGALSKDVARKIYRKYEDISLDWLWRGRDMGLSIHRSEELAAAFRRIAAEEQARVPTKRRKTKKAA